jgi:hypothetical protein
MAASAKVTKIIRNNGRLLVEFDGSTFLEFDSVQYAKDVIGELDTSPNMAQLLAIAYWLARSSDASNTAIILGKTLTFDLSNASPIKVQ